MVSCTLLFLHFLAPEDRRLLQLRWIGTIRTSTADYALDTPTASEQREQKTNKDSSLCTACAAQNLNFVLSCPYRVLP